MGKYGTKQTEGVQKIGTLEGSCALKWDDEV